MTGSRFSFTAEVWEHEGQGAWHFVSLPASVADQVEAEYGDRARGFGSLRVEVSIGKTRWTTSIFPDRKRGTYLLPVKRTVRVAEQLVHGAVADVDLQVIQ